MKETKPIHFILADRANNLIGKTVLCSDYEDGLIYKRLGTLVGISGITGKFICNMDASKMNIEWNWIKEYS